MLPVINEAVAIECYDATPYAREDRHADIRRRRSSAAPLRRGQRPVRQLRLDLRCQPMLPRPAR
jgi:hypothetical protein